MKALNHWACLSIAELMIKIMYPTSKTASSHRLTNQTQLVQTTTFSFLVSIFFLLDHHSHGAGSISGSSFISYTHLYHYVLTLHGRYTLIWQDGFCTIRERKNKKQDGEWRMYDDGNEGRLMMKWLPKRRGNGDLNA